MKDEANQGQYEKVFFNPGDVVEIRQDIKFKPPMVVKSVDKATIRADQRNVLFGIRCFWFTEQMEYQEKIFNTKDLNLLE